MRQRFVDRLARLRSSRCENVEAVEYEEPARDSIYDVGTTIRFEDGTVVSAQFWRLIKEDKASTSIFDHRQVYGGTVPIDAIQFLQEELRGKQVLEATVSAITGDLLLRFEGELALEVFNFTSFEIWEVTFPDATGELSNYVLAT